MTGEQLPVDFVNIFDRKVAAEKSFDDRGARMLAEICSDVRVGLLRKRIPVVAFLASRGQVNRYQATPGLWVESSSTLDTSQSYHFQILSRMGPFFLDNGINFAILSSAFMVVDGEDRRHLILDSQGTVNTVIHAEYYASKEEKLWLRVARDYKLASILGHPKIKNSETKEREVFIDSDLLGRLRWEEYLLCYASDRKMTEVQFLRFRLLVEGSRNSGIPLNYAQLADEITHEEK